MIDDLPRLREVIQAANLAADKRLGQHFLLDPTILDRIADLAEPLRDRPVLEVGPGPGGLTRALLRRGALVTAIEKDGRCLPLLERLGAAVPGRLRVVAGDALRLTLADLGLERATIVANLPYNVGTALLLGWLKNLGRIEAMHLMFQKEVAARLTAAVGSPDYGRISVLASLTCRVERRFDLPPGAFHPPPRVTSSVVSLWPRPDRPDAATLMALGRVTAAAFGNRRKMLRQSLKPLGAERLLAAAEVAPDLRAERVTPAQFLTMAAALETA